MKRLDSILETIWQLLIFTVHIVGGGILIYIFVAGLKSFIQLFGFR